jgi:hypothetical protein
MVLEEPMTRRLTDQLLNGIGRQATLDAIDASCQLRIGTVTAVDGGTKSCETSYLRTNCTRPSPRRV